MGGEGLCNPRRSLYGRDLDGGGAVLETHKLLLSDLQLAPLDVVFGVEPLPGVGQGVNRAACSYQARLAASGFPAQRVASSAPHDRRLGAQN